MGLSLTLRSVKAKLMAVIVTIASVISAAQIATFSYLDSRVALDNRRIRTNAIAQIIAFNAVPSLEFADARDATAILQSLREDPAIRAGYLFDVGGELLAYYLREGEKLPAPPAIQNEPEERLDGYLHRLKKEITIEGRRGGTLYLVSDFSELIARRNMRFVFGVAVGLVGLLLALLLAWWLQGLITTPVAKLATTMKRVTADRNYSIRAEQPHEAELALLADGLNHMLGAVEIRDQQLAEQMNLLERSNEELDRRVIQRTAQLEAINKELESFSYSVSHDLRAPLRSIEGFSQVLLSDFGKDLDPEAQRFLNIIIADVQKMGRLIDDLLAFSRMGRQQMGMALVDMKSLAQQVFDQVSETAGNKEEIDFVLGELPAARGDVSMLRQVLVNLIANAIKFSSAADGRPRIEVHGAVVGSENVYTVRDNGVGFDSRFAHKLFGVFQRLHSEEEFPGTGVGLALVQRIVQRHGGTVSAESELGHGALFRFSIPIIEEGPNAEL